MVNLVWMKFFKLFLGIILCLIFSVILYFYLIFQGPSTDTTLEQFVIQSKVVSEEEIINNLVDKGYLKHKKIFNLILDLKSWHGKIQPGAYLISKNMNVFQLAATLTQEPYRKWVTIPPGKRKEQVALIIQKALGWSEEQVVSFIKKAPEGYLFPDTYLLQTKGDSSLAIRTMQTNFNEKFDSQLQKDLVAQNVRNETVLKIASLVERESGGDEDKPIIAGIIWNRLLKGMKLEIDATVQYALATDLCQLDEGNSPVANCNFWPLLGPGRVRTIISDYNTYLHQGLPPAPISNPSLASIKAAIYPAETEAYFYLHSPDKSIHTARTLKEHNQNINKYLR